MFFAAIAKGGFMKFENKIVFGVYRSAKQLRNAIHVLMNAGFKDRDIWIVRPNVKNTRTGAPRKPTNFAHQLNSNAGYGAKVGAIVGFILAAIASYFIWQTYASYLMTAIAIIFGIGFGAASGALIGIGTPQRALYRYLGYIGTGAKLLSIHVSDLQTKELALTILENTNAEDISEKDMEDAQQILSKAVVSHPDHQAVNKISNEHGQNVSF